MASVSVIIPVFNGQRFLAAAIAVAAVTGLGILFAQTGRKPAAVDVWPIVIAGAVTIAALWLLVRRKQSKSDESPVDALPTRMGPTVVGRRQFFTIGGSVAGVAALTAVAGRKLQGDPQAAAVRNALTLPKATETLGAVNPKATAAARALMGN